MCVISYRFEFGLLAFVALHKPKNPHNVLWLRNFEHISVYGASLVYFNILEISFVQAQYWHDPMNEDVYRAKSQFLAEINQETAFNNSYRENLLMADNLVLVRFMSDKTVIPDISEVGCLFTPTHILLVSC